MSAEQLGQYRQWFLELIPERIEQLSAVVHQSADHTAWAADESPTSLDLLGDWFAAHVETRARTTEEIDQLTNGGKLTIEGVDKELTNATFSRATDVGMYLGRVVLKNVPETAWQQETKKTVNYGQLVIQGLGPMAAPRHLRELIPIRFHHVHGAEDGVTHEQLRQLHVREVHAGLEPHLTCLVAQLEVADRHVEVRAGDELDDLGSFFWTSPVTKGCDLASGARARCDTRERR